MAVRTKHLVLGAAGAVGGATAAMAGLAGQVWWAVSRPYPSFVDLDCSGIEGDAGPIVRLAACGDSTLTGPGLDRPDDVWLRQAARKVAADLGVRIDTRILAVGGSRAADVLADQVPFLEEVRPDVTVVAVGANDVLRGTPPWAFRPVFAELIDRLAAASGQVVAAGLGDLGAIPRLQRPLSDLVTLGSRLMNRNIRLVAERAGPTVHHADSSHADEILREATADVFSPDRFHVSVVGHSAWAAAAIPPLRKAVAAVLPGVEARAAAVAPGKRGAGGLREA